jgi:hypothetical protein
LTTMHNTRIPRPPVPLPASRETLRISDGETVRFQPVWNVSRLPEGEWTILAGPFDLGTEAGLLISHLRQIAGTWSVLAETGPEEYCIYRHASEFDMFSTLSGTVFPRVGLAPWMREEAEYWSANGCFKVLP